jgi:hypothetical protein
MQFVSTVLRSQWACTPVPVTVTFAAAGPPVIASQATPGASVGMSGAGQAVADPLGHALQHPGHVRLR